MAGWLSSALLNMLTDFRTRHQVGGALVRGDESLMAPKAHGTTATPVQQQLRWNVDRSTADRICSFNRHYAEYSGYYKNTDFIKSIQDAGEVTYYDSVSGKPLFVAPRGEALVICIR
eukprot:scaffold58874_cov33-Tisochrysis_lutea.AAC.2